MNDHETHCYCGECIEILVQGLMLIHPYTLASMGETEPFTHERALAYLKRHDMEVVAIFDDMVRDGATLTPRQAAWLEAARRFSTGPHNTGSA